MCARGWIKREGGWGHIRPERDAWGLLGPGVEVELYSKMDRKELKEFSQGSANSGHWATFGPCLYFCK